MMMKAMLCIALIAAVSAQCGNGNPAVLAFENASTNFVINPAQSDVTINCANPIDGAACNPSCSKAGKCGRYFDDEASAWIEFGNVFYSNGGTGLNIRTTDDELIENLLASSAIEAYIRCDNFANDSVDSCLTFTLEADDALVAPATCDADNNPVVCPPEQVVTDDDMIGSCTFAQQVYSWTNEVNGTDYKVDLQFTVDSNITFWEIDWTVAEGHAVSPFPWNVRCHEQEGEDNHGYAYPSNQVVQADTEVCNIGFMAWSGDDASNDGVTSLSINGVQCAEVEYEACAGDEAPFVPVEECSILFANQVINGGLANFPLPDENTGDVLINCDNLIASDAQCNSFSSSGFGGRYLTAEGEWIGIGNMFYTSGDELSTRNFFGDEFRQELLDATKIQVYTRCGNDLTTSAAVTNCVEFSVSENNGEEICPESFELPAECFEVEATPIDTCTYAYQVREEEPGHFTLDFQFTPSNTTGGDVEEWEIEFTVADEVTVVPTPWNVNCFAQNGAVVTGSNYPSNAFIMNNMMATNLGYRAHRTINIEDPEDIPSSDIIDFQLNGVTCTETMYMVGADNATYGDAAVASLSAVGIVAIVAAVALVVAGVALTRRVLSKSAAVAVSQEMA